MKPKSRISFLLTTLMLLLGSVGALAQNQGATRVSMYTPASSIERPEDAGVRAHTNYRIRMEGASMTSSTPQGETPQSLREVYEQPDEGGRETIAIVDAYHYPTARHDFNVFSRQFDLPTCDRDDSCFTVVFATGTQPALDPTGGWEFEAAIDIEWAHAMAPNAKIVLVEAASNAANDLFAAVDVASSYVTKNGGRGEVSMSWGFTEASFETLFDHHFSDTPNVVYVDAVGDIAGQTHYPAVSPNVVSAGGTSILRSPSGRFLSETAWINDSGGPSAFEPKPTFQIGVPHTDPTQRSTPDLSFVADNVAVYDSTPVNGNTGWFVASGTSISAPALTGVINTAGRFSTSSAEELSIIYAHYRDDECFRDITKGMAGPYKAGRGYDFATGVGVPEHTCGK